ncbi:MAG: hypothetical protein K8S27_03050 [Candidatus Omnitrophica bacterium]|nr:hypothetical protein [Candidatus Omnitrophota bacterium]
MDKLNRNQKGGAFIAMVLILSSLVAAVALCAFALRPEAGDDERYEITRQRMLEVKRALIGRLADVGGGADITSCGGFISDYGEPDDMTGNFIDRLINRPAGWQAWQYDLPPNNYQFWAGYRGDSYLEANAENSSGTPIFIDGWGYPIEVEFPGASPNRINIISRGKDGGIGAVNPESYDEDVTDTFYWRRPVEVTNNIGANADFRIIYPIQGNIVNPPVNSGIIPSLPAPLSTHTFSDISIGLRKIEVQDLTPGGEMCVKMLCVPPGMGNYSIRINSNCD